MTEKHYRVMQKNSIEIYHFNPLDYLNKNIKTHASLNLYGGYSNDGEANGNKIVFRLKKPLKISDNFYGKNITIFTEVLLQRVRILMLLIYKMI
ncbi:hypothetical protein ACS0HA_000011 [Campylobacter jejuni]|uniref:hypothetical protein n=1 Tax=Campylobacter jejuni TaxID=197 RepID=UPI00178C93BD|nr:hypothetical protein [Campylobacter jejuni]HDV7392916.1 hypothetical protein [Campylobacter jejuni]HDV7423432.1 hypothetical protein [Campylobacter jejuni]HEB7710426.1 hypothetical protein [Campylobacter jejuni]HEB9122389.1 hypothetical protein [Campylobacter jejuni]